MTLSACRIAFVPIFLFPTFVPAAATEQEIAQAIRQLGDNEFAVREQASQFLWKAGKAAEPALKEALKSTDPEISPAQQGHPRQIQMGHLRRHPRENRQVGQGLPGRQTSRQGGYSQQAAPGGQRGLFDSVEDCRRGGSREGTQDPVRSDCPGSATHGRDSGGRG